MIFDAIWAINRIMIIIIIRLHTLLKYLNEIDFRGAFTMNILKVIHVNNMIMLVVFILFKLDHFCFELGNREIT